MRISSRKEKGSFHIQKFVLISVMCASFFFISCGIPQSPFIVDDSDVSLTVPQGGEDNPISLNGFTSIELDLAYLDPIKFHTGTWLDTYETGMNIYYFYAPEYFTKSSSAISGIEGDIDSTISTQKITIDDTAYSLYRLVQSSLSSMPTVRTNQYFANFSNIYSVTVKLELESSDVGEEILSATVSPDDSTNGYTVSLKRPNHSSNSLVPGSTDYDVSGISSTDSYYLYLFGTVYCANDSGLYDNSVAITDGDGDGTGDGVYLGCIEFLEISTYF